MDSHSSRPDVAVRLEQPTRERRGPRQMLPYLVLLQVGFAMPRGVVPARGALLPHRFTLTTHLATLVLPTLLGIRDLAVARCAPNVKSGQSAVQG